MSSSPGRKPAVDEQDVRQALATLEDLGKPKNAYQVRKLLGEGSYQTIKRMVDAVVGEVDDSEPADPEDTLRIQLVEAIYPVAKAMQDQTMTTIQGVNERHQQEKQEMQDVTAELKADMHEQGQELKTRNQALRAAEKENEKRAADIVRLADQVREAKQALQHADELRKKNDSSLADMQAQRDKAQSEWHHLDAQLKRQIETKDRRYDEKVSEFGRAMKTANEEHSLLRTQITELEKDVTRLDAQSTSERQRADKLEVELYSVNDTLGAERQSSVALKQSLDETQAELRGKTNLLDQLTRDLEETEASRNKLGAMSQEHEKVAATLREAVAARDARIETLEKMFAKLTDSLEKSNHSKR